jgi:hypothetical protein
MAALRRAKRRAQRCITAQAFRETGRPAGIRLCAESVYALACAWCVCVGVCVCVCVGGWVCLHGCVCTFACILVCVMWDDAFLL